MSGGPTLFRELLLKRRLRLGASRSKPWHNRGAFALRFESLATSGAEALSTPGASVRVPDFSCNFNLAAVWQSSLTRSLVNVLTESFPNRKWRCLQTMQAAAMAAAGAGAHTTVAQGHTDFDPTVETPEPLAHRLGGSLRPSPFK